MCNNCNNSSCRGCTQQCSQFPSTPGSPGQVGPIGPQGPPGPAGQSPVFNIVNFDANCVLPGQCPYVMDGTENIILVNIPTPSVPYNTVDIYLPPANDPLMFTHVFDIKDAFGNCNIINIVIHPDGTDTIEGVNAQVTMNVSFESLSFVTNKTNGYNII